MGRLVAPLICDSPPELEETKIHCTSESWVPVFDNLNIQICVPRELGRSLSSGRGAGQAWAGCPSPPHP